MFRQKYRIEVYPDMYYNMHIKGQYCRNGVVKMIKYKITGFSDEISPDTTEQFEALREMGIEYFEPRNVDGKNISSLTEEEAELLKKKIDIYGIKVSSIGSPIGKIDITDDFDAHMDLLRNTINVAKIIGTKYIRIFSFFISDGKYEEHRDEVMYRMKKMAEAAEESGVILLHENEKGIYGDIPKRCLDILEETGSSSLRAVFDPANFVQCGASTYPDGFDMLKKHICYMHIKDARKDGSVVPSGFGEGHLREIIGALSDMNYEGFLSLEPHLGSFDGLEKLELGDEMLKLEKSDKSKFKIAYDALSKILEEVL